MDYNNKKFSPVTNSDNGEVSADVIFHYTQKDRILTCQYAGGKILMGHLIGLVDANGCIDMRYHQVNKEGLLMTGICTSTPEVMADGRIRLHERWTWTSGDLSSGHSVLEEI